MLYGRRTICVSGQQECIQLFGCLYESCIVEGDPLICPIVLRVLSCMLMPEGWRFYFGEVIEGSPNPEELGRSPIRDGIKLFGMLGSPEAGVCPLAFQGGSSDVWDAVEIWII